MKALARTILAAALCSALCSALWAGSTGPALAQPAPAPPAAAPPAVDAERLAAAHELIEASGASAVMTNVVTLMRGQMIAAIQQNASKSKEDATSIVDDLLLPEMRSRVGELADRLAAIYAGTYSADEMHQLVAFYKSPLGAKLISTAPQLAMQGMAAGQAWGRQVAQDALRKNADELQKRGVKL